MEKKVSLWLLYGSVSSFSWVSHAWNTIDYYSYYFHSSYWKFVVELEEYIASRPAINSSFFLIYSSFLPASL